MGEAKYSLFSKRTPNQRQGDEVYDKWKRQDNIGRELDIREGKLEADAQARKDAKRQKYKGETKEDWAQVDKAGSIWTGIGKSYQTQAQKLFVEIQDSDMSDADKAMYMEQIESNPDSLVTLFTEYNKAVGTISGNNKLNPEDSTRLLNELKGFISGDFELIINKEDGYAMQFKGLDENGKEKLFDVQDVMENVQRINKEYQDYESDIFVFDELSKNNTVAADPMMLADMGSDGFWKLKPKDERMTMYRSLSENRNFRNDVDGKKKEDALNRMDGRDVEKAKWRIAEKNAAIKASRKPKEEKERKTQWEWRPKYVNPQPTLGGNGYTTIPLVEGGRVSSSMVSGLKTKDGGMIAGIPTKITYDLDGNPTSISVGTADPTVIDKYKAENKNMSVPQMIQAFGKNIEVIDLTGDDNIDNRNYVKTAFVDHLETAKGKILQNQADLVN